MSRKLIPIIFLILCLTSLWGKTTSEMRFVRQPSAAFTVGPGTVISVHVLDMPFGGRRYAIKYRTDGGEVIEVWHPANYSPVLVGMYGMLTYSKNPEMILNFQVMQQSSRPAQSAAN